jgi:hypothetical protein
MPIELTKTFPSVNEEKLVRFLLKETSQADKGAVNPKPILDLLKLNHYSVDLTSIPPDKLVLPDKFKALLYYPERLIATENTLSEDSLRFSVFHEIAHYVLPNHQDNFFLCYESDLEGRSKYNNFDMEREANHFAAEIMFNGDLFSKVANDMKLNAKNILKLKEQFKTSIIATARHWVEKTFRPALLVIYEKKTSGETLDPETEAIWDVKYCVYSRSFERLFGVKVSRNPDNEIVKQLGGIYRDLKDSIKEENECELPDGRKVIFNSEYFTNYHNVFRIMIPQTKVL